MIFFSCCISGTQIFGERSCLAGALPCKPVHFYGRDEHLNEIVDTLSESNGKRLVTQRYITLQTQSTMDMSLSTSLAAFTSKMNLMSISNQLTIDDLEKMKFCVQGYIPKGKLQNITKPFELFSLMMENDLLSPTNVNVLAKLLESAGRFDLLPLVQQTEAEGKLK